MLTRLRGRESLLCYNALKAQMHELTWELLTEVSGRMQADLIKSHLEAEGIEVELFQEAVGRHAYPVTVDGLGRVQLFVSKKQVAAARRILAEHER